MEKKKLMKSNDNVMINGVCAGIAEYYDLDPTLVRVGWAIFSCFGAGILAYIICMIIMPKAGN